MCICIHVYTYTPAARITTGFVSTTLPRTTLRRNALMLAPWCAARPLRCECGRRKLRTLSLIHLYKYTTMSNKARGKQAHLELARAVAGELMPRRDEAKALVPRPKRELPAAMRARHGLGRPKGVANKFTREVKMVIAECFTDIGGRKAFAAWARANRTEFYKLYSKLLPIQMQGAANGNSIHIHISDTESKL